MNYATRFSLGDSVWAVQSDDFRRIVKCKPCGNTGKVLIGDESLICPKCNGRSTHTQYAGKKFYIAEFNTIVGKIRVEHTDSSLCAYQREGEENPKFEYMLTASGVGSGQIWKEERLFASEREAQAFCDMNNGLLLPNETDHGNDIIGRFGEVLEANHG